MANPSALTFNLIAGLDPAIHPLAKKMDPRVKPAGDAAEGVQLHLYTP